LTDTVGPTRTLRCGRRPPEANKGFKRSWIKIRCLDASRRVGQVLHRDGKRYTASAAPPVVSVAS
jgi:hypothetical protein